MLFNVACAWGQPALLEVKDVTVPSAKAGLGCQLHIRFVFQHVSAGAVSVINMQKATLVSNGRCDLEPWLFGRINRVGLVKACHGSLPRLVQLGPV